MTLYNDGTLVSYLKEVMEEEGISLRKFAKMSGIPHATVHRIVTGASKPTLENAIRIAEGLGMDICLIGEESEGDE